MEQQLRSKVVKMILESKKENLEKQRNYEFAKEDYIEYLATISAYKMIDEITDEEGKALEIEAAQVLAVLEDKLPRHR